LLLRPFQLGHGFSERIVVGAVRLARVAHNGETLQ
jgi:hypothetical protein